MLDQLKSELRRLGNTSRWSWQGLTAAWATEKSLRQWVYLYAASVVLALVVDLSPAERGLVLSLGVLVIVAELLNTAIEEVVDYISTDQNPHAKKAKDVGSAVVMMTAIAAGVAWAVVLIG